MRLHTCEAKLDDLLCLRWYVDLGTHVLLVVSPHDLPQKHVEARFATGFIWPLQHMFPPSPDIERMDSQKHKQSVEII